MLGETGEVGQALQMNQELGLGLDAEPLHQHSGEKGQKQPPTATWLRDRTELVTAQSSWWKRNQNRNSTNPAAMERLPKGKCEHRLVGLTQPSGTWGTRRSTRKIHYTKDKDKVKW